MLIDKQLIQRTLIENKTFDPSDRSYKIWGEIYFSTSKLHAIMIFNLKLQCQVTDTLQLSKPDKFGCTNGFGGGFLFPKNNKDMV